MNNLLRANMARMIQDKVFRACVTGSVLYGIFICLSAWHETVKYGTLYHPEEFIFRIYLLSGFFVAVFCSLFVGTEYSEGTLRNKLVVGRTRVSIYLSDFLTVAVANLLICLAFMLVTLAFSIPVFGWFSVDFGTLFYYLTAGVLRVFAAAAICNLLSMLNQNKALTAVISVLLVTGALLYASYSNMMLNQPEAWETYNEADAEENILTVEMIENPMYPTGFQRAYFELVMDLLPAGQGMQLSGMEAPRPVRMPVYSLLTIIAVNGAGLFFFCRKDLK